MNDQTNNGAVGFQGGGQPPATPPVEEGGEPAQQSNVPATISQEQLDEISDNVFRRFQGLQDKHADTISKKISEQFQALNKSIETAKASGVEITPEQETKMRNKIMTDAYLEDNDSSPPAITPGQAPPAQGPGEEQAIDPVTADGIAIMEEKGVFIMANDPEASLLSEAKSPRQYYAAVEKAIETKAARLKVNPKGDSEDPGKPPATPGRMPTNAGGGGVPSGDPIANTMDPDTLWDMAKKRGRV